jgi:signal transduction histidine kinase
LAGVFTHFALGCFAAAVYARERREPAVGVFVLLMLSLATLHGAYAVYYLTPEVSVMARALQIAWVGRVAVALFFVHLLLLVDEAPRWSYRVIGVLYGAALAGSVAMAVEAALAKPPIGQLYSATLLGVIQVRELAVTRTLASTALSVLAVAGAWACVWLTASSLRRGHRSAMTFFGASVLAAAVLHDAAREAGWFGGLALSPLGYVTMLFCIGVPWTERYAALRDQLELRTKQLKRKERALLRSYEELRTAQSELVRKEQLAAVGELSAVIAHEVRNPIAIMSNAISTLRREGLGAEDRETLLAILEEEALRLNRLVGDLLRYAKPVNVQRQLVSLTELIGRALTTVRTHPRITVEVIEETPVDKIWGDANLLRGVIENLVNNAVQAMSDTGVLTVRLCPAQLGSERGVEVQIEDTGEGMDTTVRSRAMDPFFTTRATGTGLGLAIVARIIDAHGGHIKIRSAAEVGTIVYMRLPVASEAPSKELRTAVAKTRSSVPPMLIEVRKAIGGPEEP